MTLPNFRSPADLRGKGDIRGPLERHLRALQAAVRSIGSRGWRSFVPVLETSAIQPVLGTNGNIAEARWVQVDDLVHVQGQLRYGATGETIGTGNYFIKFGGITDGPPLAQTIMGHINGTGLPAGVGKLNDNSAGVQYFVDLELDTNARVGLYNRASPATRVTTLVPFIVAENDRFRFSFWFEAA